MEKEEEEKEENKNENKGEKNEKNCIVRHFNLVRMKR